MHTHISVITPVLLLVCGTKLTTAERSIMYDDSLLEQCNGSYDYNYYMLLIYMFMNLLVCPILLYMYLCIYCCIPFSCIKLVKS